MSKIKDGTYEVPRDINLKKDEINLIMRLLQHDPLRRISWEDFFNHPYIKSPVNLYETSDEDKPDEKPEESKKKVPEIKKDFWSEEEKQENPISSFKDRRSS